METSPPYQANSGETLKMNNGVAEYSTYNNTGNGVAYSGDNSRPAGGEFSG